MTPWWCEHGRVSTDFILYIDLTTPASQINHALLILRVSVSNSGFIYSGSGTRQCCIVPSSASSSRHERDHRAFASLNASSPAATRVPAMSADQSSTGKLVVPVRAWAECSARAVSRWWCAVSIAGIGELCSELSLRMCAASLTPPSMAKPSVPSNLLCSILSPYETHLQKKVF